MQISRTEKIIIGIVVVIVSTFILFAVREGWQRIQNAFDTGLTIPRGGVVAFDLPDGCPAGWLNFAEGAGKTVVGSGGPYGYRSMGGTEMVVLTVGEMPSHSHVVVGTTEGGRRVDEWGHTVSGNGSSLRLDADDGPPFGEITGTLSALAEGEGQPHENRPPYIALYLCKKD